MEEYVGKICPFCKTKISADDEVMICPACNTPHHKSCWDENKGCTTFGCTEQHYEEQGTNPTDVCKKCGAPLGDGQDFCPKCGTPKNEPKKNVCANCGAELAEGQDFCPKCGHKVGLAVDSNVDSAIEEFNAKIEQKNKRSKKSPLKFIIISVAALALIVTGIIFIPKTFVSVDDLCEQGNYLKAYEKADDSEKIKIKAESIAAERSAFIIDNLKNPSSFKLNSVHYMEYNDNDGNKTARIVLYISFANGFGTDASEYWLYSWNNKKQKWQHDASVSNLEEETIYDSDITERMVDKIFRNMDRDDIKETIEKGIKLDESAIERINNMYEKETLDEVEPISISD